MEDAKFQFIIPATIEKAENDEWRVYGLASTTKRDSQGEVVDVKGLDLSPIEKGKGLFNWDHKKGPENTVGVIDKYKKSEEGLYLGGYLFKNHEKAKSVYQIMSSLKKSDRGRVGLSIEGVIKKRDGADGKTIAKAVVTACALTMSPVNGDTYSDLVKSWSGVEFENDSISENLDNAPAPEVPANATFTSEQVVALMRKALGVGTAYATSTPAQLTGGDALAQEELDHKKKKRKSETEPVSVAKASETEAYSDAVQVGAEPASLRKMSPELYKSAMNDLLAQLQQLYPEATRSELWETCKERLQTRYGVKP